MAKLKQHPGRKRRIGGWVLLSLALLVAGVWGASGYGWIGYISSSSSWHVLCDYGTVQWTSFPRKSGKRPGGWSCGWLASTQPLLFWNIHTPAPAFSMSEYDWSCGVLEYWTSRGGDGRGVNVTLWPLPLLLTLAGVPVLRSGVRALRRGKAGSCPACGYDRRGIPAAAVCPECGKG